MFARAIPGDLVLLDPFHVHERCGKLTAAEAFVALAERNVGTILWYAIYDPADGGVMLRSIDDGSRRGWCSEIIGDTSEGGLAGCGVLTARLSTKAETAARSIVQALARALAGTRPGLRVI